MGDDTRERAHDRIEDQARALVRQLFAHPRAARDLLARALIAERQRGQAAFALVKRLADAHVLKSQDSGDVVSAYPLVDDARELVYPEASAPPTAVPRPTCETCGTTDSMNCSNAYHYRPPAPEPCEHGQMTCQSCFWVDGRCFTEPPAPAPAVPQGDGALPRATFSGTLSGTVSVSCTDSRGDGVREPIARCVLPAGHAGSHARRDVGALIRAPQTTGTGGEE